MRILNMLPYIVIVAVVSLVSAAPVKTAFTYQGRLHNAGDPAEGLYEFSFRLMDEPEEGKQAGQIIILKDVMLTGGYFMVSLDFGQDVFDGTSLWLEIAVAKKSKLTFPRVTLSPRQPLTATPYAIRAQSLSGTIDFSQITGMLGHGYTLLVPDIMYNRAILEMDGIQTDEPVVVIVGPGVDIDRIEGFDSLGQPVDSPGYSMEHPFVFEMGGSDTVEMKEYFDAYAANPTYPMIRNFSVIVRNLGGGEFMRWNFTSFAPQEYKAGLDGRTQFVLGVTRQPDQSLQWQMVGADFKKGGSYNPATDKLLEIEGVGNVYSQVQVDTAGRKLTFTHSRDEGGGLHGWMKVVLEGLNDLRSVSIIELGDSGQEIGRDHYYGCFPIRYEVLEGFGLDTTLKVRVTLSYNHHL